MLEILGPDVQPHRGRKPPWFKVPAPGGPRYRELQQPDRVEENLHTVCQEAACPNIGECWQRGTATFMILGDTCTRRCGFCNVKTGKPTWNDPLEPARVARSVATDGPPPRGDHERRPRRPPGLRRIRVRRRDQADPPAGAEVQGRGADPRLPRRGDAAREGDRRATRRVQPQRRGRARGSTRWRAAGSTFERSCRVLRNAKEMGGDEVVTKSGLMVGLGETLRGDGRRARHAARAPRPGADDRPVPAPDREPPADRPLLAPGRVQGSSRRAAYELGFEHVAAGPLVRSSYHADQHVPQDEPAASGRWPRRRPHEPPAPRAR